MKVLSVEDYNDFECIGGKCPISCCGGDWLIRLDKASEMYYRSVEGEFGERLRAAIVEKDGSFSFRLNEKQDCVFLDEHKLCDIYKHLGPDSLCHTCKTYPRMYHQVGDILFCYLTNSCPEVTRRVLQRKEPLQVILNDSAMVEMQEKDTDWERFNYAIRAYTTGMNLLQNRDLAVQERVTLMLVFVSQFQLLLEQKQDPAGLITVFATPEVYKGLVQDIPIHDRDYHTKLRVFMIVFRVLLCVSYDHPMWHGCRALAEQIAEKEEVDLGRLQVAFDRIDSDEIQQEMEQLLTYRFFVAFMQGYEKGDYFERIAYECVLYAALWSYMALMESEQEKVCSVEDRVLFYSLCSRTDHSAERRELMQQEIKEEGFASLESLLRLIS